MNRNSVSLHLTEPVIFLRNGLDSASHHQRMGSADHPPALLRGLLTLKLVKPTRIKSIEVLLEGISRTDWPDAADGMTSLRVEVAEENKFLSSTVVLFHAESQKRSRTIGPGVILDDRRCAIETGPGDSLESESSGRGRRTRLESNDMHGSHLQPSTAYNRAAPLRAISEATRPNLHIDFHRNSDVSEDAHDPGSSIPSPINETDTPPLYSSISVASPNRPTTGPTTGEPSQRKTSRRSSSRLSFSGMLNDVKGIMQGSPSRHIVDHDRVGFHTLEGERTPEEGPDTRGRSRGRKDKGPMARIGEALGIDTHDDDDDNDDGDTNWKELKPGLYNYPISFNLPGNLPSSIEAEYGSVRYKLKAVVHRPGTFSAKLTAFCPVELVTAPADDDPEEGDAVVIEKQWDLELRYLISFSGRNFSQGSEIPWQVQLMPLSKMKLHRLSFMLDEKIEYVVPRHHLTRTEAVRRFQLLDIRHPQSLSNLKQVAHTSPPLLPILSTGSLTSSEAILLEYVDPPPSLTGEQSESERKAEELAHLLNPDGPWHLHGVMRVPLKYLHTSHKPASSFVSIKHALKVILRVEKGSEDSIDPKTGQKKQFDIIIETPVNILSKYCRPDWANLPRYEMLDPPPMTDADHPEDGVHIDSFSRGSSSSGASRAPMSPIVSPAHPSRPNTPTRDSPRASGPSSSIDLNDPQRESRAQASQRFANLIAGFEDEGGELPPTYQSIAGLPGPSRVIRVAGSPSTSQRNQSGSRGRSTSNLGSRNSSRAPDRRASSMMFNPV